MSQLQLWVVIAAPSILALVGILLNQSGLHQVENRLGARIDRLETRMDRLETRMTTMIDYWHTDVKDLLGMISDHGQRIVRLEERR